MKKKIFSMILTALMCISTLSAVNPAYAAEVQIVENGVQLSSTTQECDDTDDREPSNWATNLCKKAIKAIVKNKNAAAEVVERVAGKTVAKNFLKYFDDVVDAIEPLLKLGDIPTQMVYDAVYRGLVSAGASNSVATNIALAIKEGLSWFI